MSEEQENQQTENTEAAAAETAQASDTVSLNSLYAFKMGMTSVYDEQGKIIPVTVLKYKPWVVSQIKIQEKEGYAAVQMACDPLKAKNSSKAKANHFKKAGFENGARWAREVRQELPEGLTVGQKQAITSLQKGDKVQMRGVSKGHGFSGVMKRHGFGGGPAAHGSKFHRQPGSIGNRTWPGRVMPGRKLPGQFGNKAVNVKNVQVVEVIPEENAILVKGPVPGARNSMVQLTKV